MHPRQALYYELLLLFFCLETESLCVVLGVLGLTEIHQIQHPLGKKKKKKRTCTYLFTELWRGMDVGVHGHVACVKEGQRPAWGISSLLPPRGSGERNPGGQVWWREPLPAEFHQPHESHFLYP